jgi:hypothetical protein
MTTKNDYNQQQMDTGSLRGRHLTLLAEFWQRNHELSPDGYCGPATIDSISSKLAEGELPTFDDETPTPVTRQNWPVFEGPIGFLPNNRRQVYEVFGNPSNGSKVDKKWKKENIRTFRKKMALPGVDPYRYVKLHKLAEPYVREALRRAAEVSEYKIITFGAFNFRLMRHANRLSYHSFGIAFDINPAQNPAIRYRTVAEAPEPFSDEWHLLRPYAMDQPFVEAIKSAGFGWGGDWSTFKDDMHFELVLP